MSIEIFDCDQGSPEWYQARLGIPTASEFHTVLAKGKSGGESLTRKTYLYKLAGEIITGEPCENYSNHHMERGKQMESEARDLYAFLHDAPLRRVGFARNGKTGCSPDALVGDNGLLEIKTNLPHILIDRLLQDTVPTEYYAQCQGILWITGREWLDLYCYWPKMPPFSKRIYPHQVYHRSLSDAINQFNDELAGIVTRVRASNERVRMAAYLADPENILAAG